MGSLATLSTATVRGGEDGSLYCEGYQEQGEWGQLQMMIRRSFVLDHPEHHHVPLSKPLSHWNLHYSDPLIRLVGVSVFLDASAVTWGQGQVRLMPA